MSRPLLAVDVDGVISLFGFDEPPAAAGPLRAGRRHGALHLAAAGERLLRLAEHYELVWATGWEDKANFYLPQLLGLPELPHLSFDGAARFGSPTGSWGRSRSTAGAGRWPGSTTTSTTAVTSGREQRPEPTLLVPTEPHLGLEEAHIEALTAWASGL